MIKVITYGTFDLLHIGHIRLLERAKALGNYLIVGVTADDYDKSRGKINVQQTLIERIEAVRALGIADEIIVEEYEGQKIDDIKKYNIDIFAIGSDWKGKFDYLNEFCKVIYLERTKGISSSQIRDEKSKIKLGLVGDSSYLIKFAKECFFVNGVEIVGICTNNVNLYKNKLNIKYYTDDFEELLKQVDSVYIYSNPLERYQLVKRALENKKNVMCESPITLDSNETKELFSLAKKNKCLLQENIKTAYITAYNRMLLLVKTGKIGNVVSLDATCTSLDRQEGSVNWNSIYRWGPTTLLPVLQILGTNYKSIDIITSNTNKLDFTKINFLYEHSVAAIKVSNKIKSEGEMIISGTEGYVYIPAPWWKTDYFEIRYEDSSQNKKYFYQLNGEGIRYQIAAFVHALQINQSFEYIENDISICISKIMNLFSTKNIKI